jgi:hypothetical protein
VVLGIYLLIGLIGAIPIYRGVQNRFTQTLERFYPYPAMVVDGTVVSLHRYRVEIEARQTYAELHNLASTPEETSVFVRDQLVSRILYRSELAAHSIKVSQGDVNTKMDAVYEQVGGRDKLLLYLQQNYGHNVGLAEFRTWIEESLVESAVKQQLLIYASVRHILIAVPQDADEATVASAKAKALDIRSKITAPDQFGVIAKDYSEDIASRDKEGSMGFTTRGEAAPKFSSEFEDSVFSLALNTPSEPVRSRYGWHILMIPERGGSIDLSAEQLITKLKGEKRVRVFIPIP